MENETPLLRGLRAAILASAALLALSCGRSGPGYTEEDAADFREWMGEGRPSPARLIAGAHDSGAAVILLQDDAMRADTEDLAKGLLPALYDAGIREWGVFFMESGEQDELDALVSGGPVSGGAAEAESAKELLLAADASLGYAEYLDFLLYVRQFNAELGENEPKVRILGLSSDRAPDPSALEAAETAGNAEASGGETPETAASPFTGILWVLSDSLSAFVEAPGVADPYVVAHYRPRGDIIGEESARYDLRDRTFAFETASPPFGGWAAGPAESEADLIVVTPFADRAVRPIPAFIGPETSAAAARDFPEVRIKNHPSWAASRMNRLLTKRSNRYRKTIERP